MVALISMVMFGGRRTAPTTEPERDVAADIKAINELLEQNIELPKTAVDFPNPGFDDRSGR